MKALITGGAGFIGSNIVKLLLEHSHDVMVLDSLSYGYKENLEGLGRVKILEGDIRDASIVDKALKDVDVVFHLAASVGNARSIQDPATDSGVNVLGTLQLLESARKIGVKKVVYSSSASIFGEPQYLPIDEKHPFQPETPYAVSKMAGEKHSLCYAKLYDMDVIALRYFNVYGPNQRYDAYGNVIPIFAMRLASNQPFTVYGDGEQTRDFINVRDVAWANLLAAQSDGVSGVFNIGSGTSITINRLVRTIKEVVGVNIKIDRQPPRKGDVLHSLSDISAARSVLAFEPRVNLTEGVAEYLSWMREDSASKSPQTRIAR